MFSLLNISMLCSVCFESIKSTYYKACDASVREFVFSTNTKDKSDVFAEIVLIWNVVLRLL